MRGVFKKFTLYGMAAGLLMIFSGCGGGNVEPTLNQLSGKTLYTQVGMWYYLDKRSQMMTTVSTNYSTGTYIPVNSRVTLTREYDRHGVYFTYKDNLVRLINNKKHSRTDTGELLYRLFDMKKVDLGRFSEAEKKAIAKGKVEQGMSKEAVRISRGYPPAHVTPSLESDSWKYWESRFDSTLVNFENGKVASIIK